MNVLQKHADDWISNPCPLVLKATAMPTVPKRKVLCPIDAVAFLHPFYIQSATMAPYFKKLLCDVSNDKHWRIKYFIKLRRYRMRFVGFFIIFRLEISLPRYCLQTSIPRHSRASRFISLFYGVNHFKHILLTHLLNYLLNNNNINTLPG